ncbi:MAG: helix-turn-helix transcriptional regulator [Actinobacteria bacterium]|nr:helix-turn-helix transcriptional regulator [Actinomycetota bacterium]
MPLGKDYTGQYCSLARALEVVGERWTLLILRDAFFGVRRFGDFAAHLGVPRAVLSDRLGSLTAAGVLTGAPGRHGHTEYVLTSKGLELWPVIRTLLDWGDEHYSAAGPRRVFRHGADDAPVTTGGVCTGCGQDVPVTDLVVAPGPGLAETGATDPVTTALATPHRMLAPLHA